MRFQKRRIIMKKSSDPHSLNKLIESGKFDWVSPDITDKRFPKPQRICTDFKVFNSRNNITSGEVVQNMHAFKCEPANSHELLLFDRWDEHNPIASLGSIMTPHNPTGVLFLNKKGSERNICFGFWNVIWGPNFYFLAISRNAKH